MDNIVICAGGAVAGVASHLLYFHHGEHHRNAVTYIQVFLVTCLTVVVLYMRGGSTLGEALSSTSSLAAFYLGGLYTSLLTYRLFFNPLNKIPGPFPARIAGLWYSAKIGAKADAPAVLVKLHEKYGDFLRVGPNDLSINSGDAVHAIYGPGSMCVKAPWYDNDLPMRSMQTVRDKKIHDKRRRVWSPAFSDKALRGYETRIAPYAETLARQLAAFSGKSVNVAEWFNFYSFDVMADLAFGNPLDMLSKGESHSAIKLLESGMDPLHFYFPPWFFRLLTKIPPLTADYWNFLDFCEKKVDERWALKPSQPDLMTYLLEPYGTTPPVGTERLFMQGDSRLVIVAGSDTTAATLAHLFYHIAQDADVQNQLRTEISGATAPGEQLTHAQLQPLQYLNGAINETLRLHPPVPSALQRTTPKEGIMIGDTHIAGGTTLWTPQYVLARNERIYTQAESFVPERWYSRPEMIKHDKAFAPFSLGNTGCIGKPLALMEIRTVTARLLAQFDVKFAQGEDGTKLLTETRDRFTMSMADLHLCFEARKK